MEGSPASRREAVRRVAFQLRRHGYPRLQLSAILVVTTAIGLLSSITLLELGIEGMWLRYPIAAVLAYLAFLALLGLWQRYMLARHDVLRGLADDPPAPAQPESTDGFGPDITDSLTLFEDGPLGIALIPLLLAGLVIGLVVTAAPTLLAELMLESLLLAGLWHRLSTRRPASTLSVALRATWIPAVAVVLLLGLAGAGLQWVKPTARSIGEVFQGRSRTESETSSLRRGNEN